MVLWSYLIAEMQSSSDKTVVSIASMLISLAAAGLAVASCSSSSSGAFIGSLPQMPPAFVTAKRKLNDYSILRPAENAFPSWQYG